jgi:hypothetical protein
LTCGASTSVLLTCHPKRTQQADKPLCHFLPLFTWPLHILTLEAKSAIELGTFVYEMRKEDVLHALTFVWSGSHI